MEYQPDRLKWQIGSGLLLFGVVTFLVACGGSSKDAVSSASTDQSTALAASSSASVPSGWKPRAPSSEVINGITVPPEPAPSVNNATLAGVDSNNNGVRDDVERYVARVSRNPAEGAVILSGANAYQRLLLLPGASSPTRAQLLDIYGDTHCAMSKLLVFRGGSDDTFHLDNALMPATFNTEARRTDFRLKMKSFGGYGSSELKTCS